MFTSSGCEDIGIRKFESFNDFSFFKIKIRNKRVVQIDNLIQSILNISLQPNEICC